MFVLVLTCRPVFQTGSNKLDLTADFTPFYKQERERLGNEDILKILAEFKKLAIMHVNIVSSTLRG